MKLILNIYDHNAREGVFDVVIAELLPFDYLNFNDFFHPQP